MQLHDITAVARACATSDPASGTTGLLDGLGRLWPALSFRPVLSRGGWYRPGGVVDIGKLRVAESLRQWAEGLSVNGDLQALLDSCTQRPLFATRLLGTTHYLTARTGPGAAQFMQVEVEELQEVLDRYLSDPEWLPDSLEEFIDPLEYPQLEPEPVGVPRLVFRRSFSAQELLGQLSDTSSHLLRFMNDWSDSSASRSTHFCEHWALAVRETRDSDGEARTSAHPVAACASELPRVVGRLTGSELANLVHGYDRVAGYPMAWFFHMAAATTGCVPNSLGLQVAEDHQGRYSYLPDCDLDVLRRWAAMPYRA